MKFSGKYIPVVPTNKLSSAKFTIPEINDINANPPYVAPIEFKTAKADAIKVTAAVPLATSCFSRVTCAGRIVPAASCFQEACGGWACAAPWRRRNIGLDLRPCRRSHAKGWMKCQLCEGCFGSKLLVYGSHFWRQQLPWR